MSGHRLVAPWGVRIDRSRLVRFRFNGRDLSGYEGDSLASALIASGIDVVARSFKLHRPRGIMSCGVEEPSAIFDLGIGAHRIPNVRAPLARIREGLSAQSVNCWPSAEYDVGALQQLVAPLLTAGFYYKTFKWPNWHYYEPWIRRRAGLGRVPPAPDPDYYDEVSEQADVVVVGGGPTGLISAAAAAEQGANVYLITRHQISGETLPWQAPTFADKTLQARLERSGVHVLRRTDAFGIYDHNLICARQDLSGPGPREGGPRERLWKLRARRIILACGAIERPMLFPDNDRPGVMLADSVREYIHAYGVVPGHRVVIASNSDSAYALPPLLREVGVEVVAIVERRDLDICRSLSSDVRVLHQASIGRVYGAKSVKGCEVYQSGDKASRQRLECDFILGAGGWIPTVHLHSQAGGRLSWLEEAAMFVPGACSAEVVSVGACAGMFDPTSAFEHAEACGRQLGQGGVAPAAVPSGAGRSLQNTMSSGAGRHKQFIDFQNDVTTRDVALSATENYRSVEHFKRYTTTGMGTDQGKTSNVNALVVLGDLTSRRPPEVGTTKFRPPFVPITLGTLAGLRQGERFRARRYVPAHNWHEQRGGLFEEYGGWMRPAAYPSHGESIAEAAEREVLATRSGAGIFDGSPLGKLEVFGPDAHRFLDFMYVGTMSSLAQGRARYGLILSEQGIVVDDGIVARLGSDRFWVNTSSGGFDRTSAAFEEWAQCEFPHWQVLISPVAARWSNITVSGPKAWDWLSRIGLSVELAPTQMKHMSIRDVRWEQVGLRIMRASFCGELTYEINVPAASTSYLLDRLWDFKDEVGGTTYGIEALQIMRVEKGYIHIGADTDGTTVPSDLGLETGIARKTSDFVGRRSLKQLAVCHDERLQLVGLEVEETRTPIPTGSHIAAAPAPANILGHVTSSVYSPTLKRPIALGMLKSGKTRLGESVDLFHGHHRFRAKIVDGCFYDKQGSRLNG